jgi:hypothetical protein
MSKLTLPEACEAVADLFEAAPETWARGADAVNALGWTVPPVSPCAEAWCARGAIVVAAKVPPREVDDLLREPARRLFNMSPIAVNDRLGRKAAIRLLREAAKCQK